MAERRVPLGKPLDMSDEEYDGLAEYTPEAIEEARQALERHGDVTGRRMGAAVDDEPEA